MAQRGDFILGIDDPAIVDTRNVFRLDEPAPLQKLAKLSTVRSIRPIVCGVLFAIPMENAEPKIIAWTTIVQATILTALSRIEKVKEMSRSKHVSRRHRHRRRPGRLARSRRFSPSTACKVELFERERFPRFHIGESLIPETYWVFKRLKMLDKMKASPFVKKYSVQFVNASGQAVGPVLLPRQQAARVLADLAGHPQRVRHDDARQRPRARRRGPPAGPRAGGAVRGRPGRRRPRCRTKTARSEDVRAKVVVDASGQSTMLQNRFKLRLWDPVLNKGAIWTYWEGAYRDTGRDEGATIVIQTPNKQGWWWYIPQHDDTISVGVVAPFDYLFKGRGSHEQTYNEEVDACPAVKKRIVDGPSARPATSPPRTTRTARRKSPATAGC